MGIDWRMMEYSWGPLIPFWTGGLSVSNMDAERPETEPTGEDGDRQPVAGSRQRRERRVSRRRRAHGYGSHVLYVRPMWMGPVYMRDINTGMQRYVQCARRRRTRPAGQMSADQPGREDKRRENAKESDDLVEEEAQKARRSVRRGGHERWPEQASGLRAQKGGRDLRRGPGGQVPDAAGALLRWG